MEEEATEAEVGEEKVIRWKKETFNAEIWEKKVTWQETARKENITSQHD